jgi:hypothetical protein
MGKKTILLAAVLIIIVVLAVVLYIIFRPVPVPVVNGHQDLVSDLFDKNGAPISGEAYLDITAVDVRKNGDQYTLLMKLNDNLPRKTPELDTFIEWDFMIDADKNPTTGTNWSFISNDLGYDYLVRFGLNNGARIHEVLTANGGQHTNISFRIIQDVVELSVPASLVGNPGSFYWTAAVRKYLSGAPAKEPSISDKVPNQGHVVFPPNPSPSAPSAFQGSLTGNWSGQITPPEEDPISASGTFSVTIGANGGVQGSFIGTFSGIIAGQVDINGNLVATGTASGGTSQGVTTWEGHLSVSGSTLSGQGTWAGEFQSGIFSGSGILAR